MSNPLLQAGRHQCGFMSGTSLWSTSFGLFAVRSAGAAAMDGYPLLNSISFPLSITTPPSDVHTYTIRCVTDSLAAPTSKSCSNLTCCVPQFFKLQLIAVRPFLVLNLWFSLPV